MTGRVFVDTNVILYLLSDGDVRRERAEQVLATRPIISTQVVNEFAANCLRKSRKTREETIELATALMNSCDVRPMDDSTVRLGLSLCGRYQLSIWDAMILAAALQADADTLCSEDMQHGQVIEGRVTILNPFISS